MFGSCAKISAAQAPDGPPPTTQTEYFAAEMGAGEGAVRIYCTFILREKRNDPPSITVREATRGAARGRALLGTRAKAPAVMAAATVRVSFTIFRS